MKADAKSLKFLTMEGKVKIPFFQRTYVWNEENWEDLLEELLREKNENVFLGAIILKQVATQSGEPKQLEVIEGQQRLTTLSILLKALYDVVPDDIKRNCEGDIMNILRYRKNYASGDYELRIEHSHVDAESYCKVINNSLKLNEINEKSHLILRRYKYFYEKINELSNDDVLKLINRLLNPDNKMLVVIDLEQSDDEQAIFDALNTAGVMLTIAEIVKNSIFKKAIELKDKDYAIDLYEKTWKKTFLGDVEALKYWETERSTGRLKRDNIEILLHCFGIIKGFYDPDKNTLIELTNLYKREINKIDTIYKLETFIYEIIKYAEIYKEKILTFDKSDMFSFDDSIKRLLHILEELEISTFYPFILYALGDNQNNDDRIKDILYKLEKLVVKNMLLKVESPKNYNKLCKQFISDIKTLDNKLAEIEKKDIEQGLYNLSNREATLILFWIELFRRSRDNKYDERELKYDYELEHIMPIKWQEYWNFDKVPHPDKKLSPEEQKNDRDEKIRWLGNMTLLKSKLNKSIQNADFQTKILGKDKKKGIKHYADLLITKNDIVELFESGDRVWNEEKIKNRTLKLKSEIIQIWK